MLSAGMAGERVTYLVGEEHRGERLDRFLADVAGGRSRSEIQRLIEGGHARLNGRVVRRHHLVRAGDRVELSIPPPREAEVRAEEIPLEILHEDDDILVINKAAGMIVHPAGRVVSGTVVNALLAHCRNLSGIGGVLKPGIVHRLDKGTSGCLIVAKRDSAHRALAEKFLRREIRKEYLAVVHGAPKGGSGIIEGLIARHPVDRKRMAVRKDRGRHAVTRFEVLERFGDFTSMKITLATGRTHQIRVHMTHLGHPILGDPVYGRRRGRVIDGVEAKRPMLHAWRVAFAHPRTGREMEIEAPMPADMKEILGILRERSASARGGVG